MKIEFSEDGIGATIFVEPHEFALLWTALENICADREYDMTDVVIPIDPREATLEQRYVSLLHQLTTFIKPPK